MEKKRIILKTHGLKNSKEVGMVVLPESFYVRVRIEDNGEFEVVFFDSDEEQLFYLSYNVENTIERIPSEEELVEAEKEAADFIVDSMAEHMCEENRATYNTEIYKRDWAAFIMTIFKNE